MKTFVIAEIGINHNGDMNIVKQLIDAAVEAGCNAVKFQKRTVNKVYTKEYLDSYRESPWGTTQREQKEGLELNFNQYKEIDKYCKGKNIEWFASAWDTDSQLFLQQFNLKYNKVASAMLVNEELLKIIAKERKYTFISTGMSSYDEIKRAVEIFKKEGCPFELMHCNSTYPMDNEDANLKLISELKNRYNCKVGYSGHEKGLLVTLCAVALGATSIERHITLNKNMYGSDQKASIEPNELRELTNLIKEIEAILGTGNKVLTIEEKKIKEKLRND